MFHITDGGWAKVAEWKATLPYPNNVREDGMPVGGAIGGRYTYSFTPTGIGTIVKVHDAISKETLDLTDYENW